MLGNLAAMDNLVAIKVKVLKCGDHDGNGRYMVVADHTKACLMRVQSTNMDLMKVKTGQSILVYNIRVREDRLITVPKSTMFWGQSVHMPTEVEDAAPVLPSVEDTSTASSLAKALEVSKAVRVDVKGRVVKVKYIALIFRHSKMINLIIDLDLPRSLKIKCDCLIGILKHVYKFPIDGS